jgi:hypothetical protein
MNKSVLNKDRLFLLTYAACKGKRLAVFSERVVAFCAAQKPLWGSFSISVIFYASMAIVMAN